MRLISLSQPHQDVDEASGTSPDRISTRHLGHLLNRWSCFTTGPQASSLEHAHPEFQTAGQQTLSSAWHITSDMVQQWSDIHI